MKQKKPLTKYVFLFIIFAGNIQTMEKSSSSRELTKYSPSSLTRRLFLDNIPLPRSSSCSRLQEQPDGSWKPIEPNHLTNDSVVHIKNKPTSTLNFLNTMLQNKNKEESQLKTSKGTITLLLSEQNMEEREFKRQQQIRKKQFLKNEEELQKAHLQNMCTKAQLIQKRKDSTELHKRNLVKIQQQVCIAASQVQAENTDTPKNSSTGWLRFLSNPFS